MRVRSTLPPAAFGLAALASPALAGGYDCIGCYRHVVTPPVYGTVSEQVMVRAPRTVAHTIPGEYGSVSERVMISPPRKECMVTRDPYGNAVGCWVVVPAQYAVQRRAVMVRAPQVVHETVPPVYATHQRTVMVQPGSSGWQPMAPYRGRYGGGYGAGYGAGYGGYGGGYGHYGVGYAGHGGGAIGALAPTAGGVAAGPIGAVAAGMAADALGF